MAKFRPRLQRSAKEEEQNASTEKWKELFAVKLRSSMRIEITRRTARLCSFVVGERLCVV